MTSRAIVALGIGQCVNWGVLYYAFAVLLVPVERELGMARWIVSGAFSLALLMSGVLAPTIGRWSDRGHGPLVMQVGALIAAALLFIWTLIPGVVTLYVIWAGLGLCMAATLYEPAFAIVGRAHDHATARLRALATVTVFGGLASTIWFPCTALLVRALEWRGAVGVLACALVISTYATRIFVFRQSPSLVHEPSSSIQGPRRQSANPNVAGFRFIIAVFALVSLSSAAFTTNLVPALGEHGISPTTAALLGGVLGVMQCLAAHCS